MKEYVFFLSNTFLTSSPISCITQWISISAWLQQNNKTENGKKNLFVFQHFFEMNLVDKYRHVKMRCKRTKKRFTYDSHLNFDVK